MKEIKVKVKTLWNGMVGLHEKYIKRAEERQTDIDVYYQDEVMNIKWQLVRMKIKSRSERAFKDRFSPDIYYLYYFNWEPNVNLTMKLL